MDEWQNNDAIDILLRTISKTYKNKSATVTKWAADLAEERIWRGSNTARTRVRVAKKKGSTRK